MKIKTLIGRQILDSRGKPTVEADVILDNGVIGRAAVPSGASTGTHEALELRDNDQSVYGGQGVLTAVGHINSEIAARLIGTEVTGQKQIDEALISLDGTNNKSNLGANAILAVSLACAKAAAHTQGKQLFEYVANLVGNPSPLLPLPLMNIINGGAHASFVTDVQEFMILPIGAKSFSQALQMGSEIFQNLKSVLKEAGYDTTVGDEGGFAPRVKQGNAEALELLIKAVEKANYRVGVDVAFGLDVAASEFFQDGKYNLKAENQSLSSTGMIDWLVDLTNRYPLISIEDGLAESDWDGWKELTTKLGDKVQLVGDDLLVTNTTFLKKAIVEGASNAILVKPNQIGTLTETIEAVQMAKEANFSTIMSHRSGETEDTTIAHLAVGLATGQIKTGSLSRTDRVAKYNELLRIEELLGRSALFNPKAATK